MSRVDTLRAEAIYRLRKAGRDPTRNEIGSALESLARFLQAEGEGEGEKKEGS